MEVLVAKVLRGKRFVRPPAAERGEFELLPNHERVLEYLLFHRLLSSDQIERLTGYSSDYTRRLLEKLWKHEYVDRVKRANKSDPLCYALGVQGVKVLIRQQLYDRRNDFTDKNRNLTKDFVEHDLLTAEFMTRLFLSCKKHNARLIYFPEILEGAPESTRMLSRPYQWQVKVSFGGKSTTFMVNPDFRIFGIHYQHAPEGKNRTYLALETDMSTEPVFPTDFTKRSNLFKKLLAYHETYRKKLYTTLYGIKNLRPLFIVRPRKHIQPNPEVRIQNIIQAAQHLNCERKLFLFAADKELESSDDLLTFGWRNHLDNEPVRLLPSFLDEP
jgi:hypothetical protein